jgi:hypothetical protein
LSDVTYRIQKSAKAIPKVVHFDRLKLYTGDNPPQWKDKEKMIELEYNVDLDKTVLYNVEDYPQTVLKQMPESDKKVTGKNIKKKDNKCNQDNQIDSKAKPVEPYTTVRSKRTIYRPVRFRDD